jgi:hypothetical protein
MGKVWKRRWLRNKVAKAVAAVTPDAPVASVEPVEAAPEPVVEEEVVVPQKRVRRTRKTKGKE